jgi:hypothetical protein
MMSTTEHDIIEVDEMELELVSGGERTLYENLHRLWFALTCPNLEVKGDQLICHK